MTKEEIKGVLKNATYIGYGIRLQDDRLEIGQHAGYSRVWVDGYPMKEWEEREKSCGNISPDYKCREEYLGGISCIRITDKNIEIALKKIQSYIGDNLYLIGGDSLMSGTDEMEIVIDGYRVL